MPNQLELFKREPSFRFCPHCPHCGRALQRQPEPMWEVPKPWDPQRDPRVGHAYPNGIHYTRCTK